MSRWRDLLHRLAGPKFPVPVCPEALGVCTRCRCAMVNPVRCDERGGIHWWIRLRCGECGFVREVVATNEEARRFDRELDEGVAEIARTVRRLDRARMAAQADALAIALERDLVDAGDFEA